MISMLESSVYFGVFATLAVYFIGLAIHKKTGVALLNPLMLGVIMMIALLSVFKIDYSAYAKSASIISNLLTPATICLAVPLYEQVSLLKKHPAAIFAGIASGVLTSLLCVFVLSLLFGLDHASYVTLLPKSITTAIGIGVCQELGGYVSITAAVIIITGILGNIISEGVLKVLHITEPIAKGVAIGTSSHAIGTSKALQIGQIEGAMSSLSIVVSGILTVLSASVFAGFL
ncbi:MAG: LrgB family protein [Clostridia bacterium]|nr:LrgB family protein [Clostridia bacterium]